jgi:cell pole-organizing protein PopZ
MDVIAMTEHTEPQPGNAPNSAEIVNLITGDQPSSKVLASGTMAAIAQFAALQRQRRQQANPKTLEDVICEMMRPMLQGWLNDTLPEMIESLVRAELTRVLADAGALN